MPWDIPKSPPNDKAPTDKDGRSLPPDGASPMWSTHAFASGAHYAGTTSRFFGTARGKVGCGFAEPLSIAETNLKEGSRMPGGYAYDWHGLCVELFGGGPADFAAVQEHGVLSFDFLQTILDIAPIGALHWEEMGLGRWYFRGNKPTVKGDPKKEWPRNVIKWEADCVKICANATFGVHLSFGSGMPKLKNDLRMRITLLGAFHTAIAIG